MVYVSDGFIYGIIKNIFCTILNLLAHQCKISDTIEDDRVQMAMERKDMAIALAAHWLINSLPCCFSDIRLGHFYSLRHFKLF